MRWRWWRLAARNLGRHGRRTFLAGSIVIVGFVATTMTAGFVSQTFSGLRDVTIRGLGGQVRLANPRATGTTDDEAVAFLLDDWTAVAAKASQDPAVIQAMPRLSFFGLVAKGERSAPYMGTGTDPTMEKRASLLVEAVAEGRFLADPEADEVMLGSGLARAIAAKTGDLVTVMATTPDGSLNAIDAPVAAIIRYPIKELDDRLLYLPYRSAARLLKVEGRATAVVLLLRDGSDASEVAARIVAGLGRTGNLVSARTWLETAVFYRQVRLLYISIFLFMGLVLATVVILAAANTMTMSVFERTREIGTLLAIGMERSAVRALFLREGLLMGIGGSAMGAIVSLLLRLVLNASGIQLPPPPGGTQGSPLHVDFIPLAYGIGFVLMTSTLLIASWWPARRASRLDPVEAIAHV